MDFVSALNALVVLEKSLVITDPVRVKIKEAFDAPPDIDQALGDTPCWINTYTLLPVEFTMDSGILSQIQRFDVRMQLFCYDASHRRASQMANAFLVALLRAWDYSLNGTVSTAYLRGGTPTQVRLNHNQMGFPGLDLHADLELLNPT